MTLRNDRAALDQHRGLMGVIRLDIGFLLSGMDMG
jgi:hypothetical protein